MNKRVLITGSSRGIGKAIALKLADSGFDITVHCCSNIEQAEETSNEILSKGVASHILQFDVQDRAHAKQLLEEDVEQYGPFYGIVCNAGITRDTAFPAMEEDEWDSVIHTNLDSFYNILHPLVMPMVRARKGGRIITMASVSGIIGNRGQVNYSASKGGLIAATKSLSLELAKRKITVNCVAPGLIDTGIADETLTKEIVKHIPLRRTGSVDEVAATVDFLMSDGAAYITRQVISVNGGLA